MRKNKSKNLIPVDKDSPLKQAIEKSQQADIDAGLTFDIDKIRSEGSVAAPSEFEGISAYYPSLQENYFDKYDDYVDRNILRGGQASMETLNDLRAQNQSNWEQAGHAVARVATNVIPQTISGFASMLDIPGYFDAEHAANNGIVNWAMDLKKEVDEDWFPIYEEAPGQSMQLGDFAWWMSRGSGLVESVGSFLLQGAGMGKLVSAGVKGIGALSRGKNLATAIFGAEGSQRIYSGTSGLLNAVALNQSEAVLEATQVFRDTYDEQFKKNGGDKAKAKQAAAIAASTTMNINRANILLNLTSASAFITPLKATRKLFDLPTVGKTLGTIAAEGGQEAVEELINLAASKAGMAAGRGKDYSLEKALEDIKSMEGLEAAFLGAIGGIAQTGGTKALQYSKYGPGSMRDEQGNRISKVQYERNKYAEQQQVLDELKQKGVKTTDVLQNFKDQIVFQEKLKAANAKGDVAEMERLKEDMFENQALKAFRSGTTEVLEDLYRNEAARPVDEVGQEYIDRANQAIKNLKDLEAVYNNFESYENAEEVFFNRANKIRAERANNEIQNLKKDADLQFSKDVRDIASNYSFENEKEVLFKKEGEITGREIRTEKAPLIYSTSDIENNTGDTEKNKEIYNQFLKEVQALPSYQTAKAYGEQAEEVGTALRNNEKEFREITSKKYQDKVKAEKAEVARMTQMQEELKSATDIATVENLKNSTENAEFKKQADAKINELKIKNAQAAKDKELSLTLDKFDKKIKATDLENLDALREEIEQAELSRADKDNLLERINIQAAKLNGEDTTLEEEISGGDPLSAFTQGAEEIESEVKSETESFDTTIPADYPNPDKENSSVELGVAESAQKLLESDQSTVTGQDEQGNLTFNFQRPEEGYNRGAFLSREFNQKEELASVDREEITNSLDNVQLLDPDFLTAGTEIEMQVDKDYVGEKYNPESNTRETISWALREAELINKAAEQGVAVTELEEYIAEVPIKVTLPGSANSVFYVHDNAWYRAENLSGSEEKIAMDKAKNFAIRKAIVTKGIVKTKVDYKSYGRLFKSFDGKAISVSEAMPDPNLILAVGKDQGFQLPGEAETLLGENGKILPSTPQDGRVYAVVKVGPQEFIPIPLERTKVTEQHAKSIVLAIEGYLSQDKDNPIVKAIAESDLGLDITDEVGLNQYIRQFIYLFPTEAAGLEPFLIRGGQGESQLKSKNPLVAVTPTGIEFGQPGIEKGSYTKKDGTKVVQFTGIISKNWNKTQDGKLRNAQMLTKLEAMLKNMMSNADRNLLATNKKAVVILNRDGETSSMRYSELVKQTHKTNILSVNTGTEEAPKWAYTIQPTILFDTSFADFKNLKPATVAKSKPKVVPTVTPATTTPAAPSAVITETPTESKSITNNILQTLNIPTNTVLQEGVNIMVLDSGEVISENPKEGLAAAFGLIPVVEEKRKSLDDAAYNAAVKKANENAPILYQILGLPGEERMNLLSDVAADVAKEVKLEQIEKILSETKSVEETLKRLTTVYSDGTVSYPSPSQMRFLIGKAVELGLTIPPISKLYENSLNIAQDVERQAHPYYNIYYNTLALLEGKYKGFEAIGTTEEQLLEMGYPPRKDSYTLAQLKAFAKEELKRIEKSNPKDYAAWEKGGTSTSIIYSQYEILKNILRPDINNLEESYNQLNLRQAQETKESVQFIKDLEGAYTTEAASATRLAPVSTDAKPKVVKVYHHTNVAPQNFNFGNFQRGKQQVSQFGDGLNASSTTTPFLVQRYGNPIEGEINDSDFVVIDANKSEKELYEELKAKGYKFNNPATGSYIGNDPAKEYNSFEQGANENPSVISLFNDFQKSNPEVKGVKVINHIIGNQKVDPFYVIYDAKSFYGPGSLSKIQPTISTDAKADVEKEILGSFADTIERVVTTKGPNNGRTIKSEITSKVSSDGQVIVFKSKHSFTDNGSGVTTGGVTMTVEEFKQHFYPMLTAEEIEDFEDALDAYGTDNKIFFKELRVGTSKARANLKGQINLDIMIGVGNDHGFTLTKKLTDAELAALEGTAQLTSSDKIIWGHPGLGKTTFKEQSPEKVLDFDTDFKPKVAKKLGLPKNKQNSKGLNEWRNNSNEAEFEAAMREVWQEALAEARGTGKMLVVSDMMFLRENANDFDKIITTDKETFIKRASERGDDVSKLESWKSKIDKTIAKIDQSKVVSTNKYFSELVALEQQPTTPEAEVAEAAGKSQVELNAEEILTDPTVTSEQIDIFLDNILEGAIPEQALKDAGFADKQQAIDSYQRAKQLFAERASQTKTITLANGKKITINKNTKDAPEIGEDFSDIDDMIAPLSEEEIASIRTEIDNLVIRGIDPATQRSLVHFIASDIIKQTLAAKNKGGKQTVKVGPIFEKHRESFKQLAGFYQEAGLVNKAARLESVIDQFDKLKNLVNQHMSLLTVGSVTEDVTMNDSEEALGLEKLVYTDDWAFTISSKATSSADLKKFFSSIQDRDENGDPVDNVLGLPEILPYDVAYDTLHEILANRPADYDHMLEVMELYKEKFPWIQSVVEDLEAAPEKIQNEFVSDMAKHHIDMQFVMWSRDMNGNYSLQKWSSNKSSTEQRIRAIWKSNLKGVATQSNLVDINENDEYVFDQTVAKDLINQANNWKKNPKNVTNDELANWLGQFGIVISDDTYDDLRKGRYSNKGRKTWEGLFLSDSGLVNVLAKELERKQDLTLADAELLNDSAIKALASLEADNSLNTFSNSFQAGGKTIYSYGNNNYLVNRMRDLTAYNSETEQFINQDLIDKLKSISFVKDSLWLNELTSDKTIGKATRNTFSLSYLSLEALKKKWSDSQDNRKLNNLTAAEHEVTKLGFFQNKSGAVIDNVARRQVSFFYPTMSDKTTMLAINALAREFLLEDGQVSKKNFETLYDAVVTPEIKRMRDKQSNNISGYEPNYFYFLPSLNTLEIMLEDGNTMTFRDIVINGDDKLYSAEVKEAVIEEIERVFNNLIEKKLEDWKKLGIGEEVKDEKGKIIEQFPFMDKEYMKWVAKTGKDITKVKYAAMDYVFNYMISNAESFKLFAGDPALYAKFKANKSLQENLDETFVNIGKRLAGDIAPGIELANSVNNKYYQIFLQDKKIDSNNTKDSVQKEFFDKIMKDYSKNYSGIEGSDAQEYTTWKEHLYVLKQLGRLTDAQYNTFKTKLEAQSKGIFNDTTELSFEELGIVMQPIKPVYVGNIASLEDNADKRVYIKSSSFPLIPELTAGLQIDKIRQGLETFEQSVSKEVGPDGSAPFVRASFGTANKVGAVKNTVEVFDNNGNVVDNFIVKPENTLLLSRANFRIQQDVPYKRDKSEINRGTQETKLLFADMLDVEIEDGVTGEDLMNQYNEAYQDLFLYAKDKLARQLGLTQTVTYEENFESLLSIPEPVLFDKASELEERLSKASPIEKVSIQQDFADEVGEDTLERVNFINKNFNKIVEQLAKAKMNFFFDEETDTNKKCD